MSGTSVALLVLSLVTAGSGNTLAAPVPVRICVTAERQAMSLLRASDGAPSDISGIAALRVKERYAAARGKTLPLEFEPSAHHASSYCRDRSRTIYLDLTYQALAAGQPYRMTYTLRWPGGEQSGGARRDLAKGLGDSLRLPISPLWQLLDRELTRRSDMLAAILVKRGKTGALASATADIRQAGVPHVRWGWKAGDRRARQR